MSGEPSTSSLSSYFPSQSATARRLSVRRRTQIRANVQQLIRRRAPSSSQPPLPTSQPPSDPTSQPPLPTSQPSPDHTSQPRPDLDLNRPLPLIASSSSSSSSSTLPIPKPNPKKKLTKKAQPSSPLNMFNHTRSRETISDEEFKTLLAAKKKRKRKA